VNFTYEKEIEKWDVLEISCEGACDGNPFVDYDITGFFSSKNENKTVKGFYDGDGIYKVRFMPSFTEEYSFEIKGSFSAEQASGIFTAKAPSENNHGPVRVANTYHFAYEDGTPHYSVGTTCYVWQLQSAKLQRQTLETLKKSTFNKLRFCIFPKHYDYNLNEPSSYPYVGKPMDSSVLTKANFMEYDGNPEGNEFNYQMFNVEHFKHIEKCIEALRDMNIEADLIVMHPYDRWGFSLMTKEQDNLYWNYVIARFAAYRNVWWSLANEYDLMPQKTIEDWERYAKIICDNDPYNHLRSIHNCRPFYDHSRPWITHCSIQRQDIYKTAELVGEWRDRYKKPIVLDEIVYEGNIQHGWGNIDGEEMTRRFWEATMRGGYAGHGETYMNENDILWWSHGGKLHGTSPARIDFLTSILQETPSYGLEPKVESWDELCAVPASCEAFTKEVQDYYLYYYGFNRPSFREYYHDDETAFDVELIDTWNMTIEKLGTFSGRFKINLPGKKYMAVRMKKH